MLIKQTYPNLSTTWGVTKKQDEKKEDEKPTAPKEGVGGIDMNAIADAQDAQDAENNKEEEPTAPKEGLGGVNMNAIADAQDAQDAEKNDPESTMNVKDQPTPKNEDKKSEDKKEDKKQPEANKDDKKDDKKASDRNNLEGGLDAIVLKMLENSLNEFSDKLKENWLSKIVMLPVKGVEAIANKVSDKKEGEEFTVNQTKGTDSKETDSKEVGNQVEQVVSKTHGPVAGKVAGEVAEMAAESSEEEETANTQTTQSYDHTVEKHNEKVASVSMPQQQEQQSDQRQRNSMRPKGPVGS
ncbi:MAG: hypothetical protein NTW08_01020 [Gammaproteobacteria bacterium]|nr:hypothetical protein [Gammaproteobacteria bacterium]